MRFVEIRGNLLVPISNEEMMLLEKVKGADEPLSMKDLEERERYLSKILVHKGVLSRVRIDDNSCLVYNDLEDLWGI
jgi:hypothetical protein